MTNDQRRIKSEATYLFLNLASFGVFWRMILHGSPVWGALGAASGYRACAARTVLRVTRSRIMLKVPIGKMKTYILTLTLAAFFAAVARAELKWEQTQIELHPAVADKQA